MTDPVSVVANVMVDGYSIARLTDAVHVRVDETDDGFVITIPDGSVSQDDLAEVVSQLTS